MKQPVIGIIGLGRWGTNYLRTFGNLCSVKWVCSRRESTMREALQKANNSQARSTTNYKNILYDEDVDAVAIATPGSTHFRLATEALQAGKHVLVEKPLALSLKDAEQLARTARNKKKILMTGHLHLFNPGIQKIRSDIARGLFGKINFINMAHFGNGPVRTDMGAIWDFFPHSASILLYLLDNMPTEVSANGKSYITKGIEDIATMDAFFPGNIMASCTGSWLYPFKKMELVVVGEEMYASFDDYADNDKLRYYSSRPKISNGKIEIMDDEAESVKIPDTKPLTNEAMHFLDCVIKDKEPITGIDEALQVTKVLEAAQQSLRKKGFPVRIKRV